MTNLIAFPTITTSSAAKGGDTVSIGSKHSATADMDLADVAKLIRSDIRAAIKVGQLPAGTYSVRISRYSMGQSLTVRASIPGVVERCPERMAAFERGEQVRTTRTDAAQAVIDTLEALVGAYNRSLSNPASDYSNVRFYTHIDIAG